MRFTVTEAHCRLRSVLLIVLILSCAIAATAQNPTPTPLQKTTKKSIKVKTEYDKFEDMMSVTLEPRMQVSGGEDYGFSKPKPNLTMGASYFHKGKTPTTPKYISLDFTYRGKDWLYLYEEARGVFAIVDGERIELGQVKRIGSNVEKYGIEEKITLILPIETYMNIARGSSLELKVGPIEFKLKDKHLQTLREFADYVSAPGANSHQ